MPGLNDMEIKKDKSIIIPGKAVCLTVGIQSAICGLYWLVKALFFDGTELPAILSSFAIALFFTLYARKH